MFASNNLYKICLPKTATLLLDSVKEAREVDAVYIEERMLVRVSFSAKFGDGFSTKSANTPSGMATLTNLS